MSDVKKPLGWVLVNKDGVPVSWHTTFYDFDPNIGGQDNKRKIADETDKKDAPHRWQPVIAAPAVNVDAGWEFYEALRAADPEAHPEGWDDLTERWKQAYTLAARRTLASCAGHPTASLRVPLTKSEVDDIVYRCRQNGDDSTYAVVRAVEQAHGVKNNKDAKHQ